MSIKHLEPQETWLFDQQLVEAFNKETPKLCIAVPLWGQATGQQGLSLTKAQ